MPGPYRERIYGVAVKIEATSGVDAVPDPAVDAVQTVGIPYLEMDYLEPGTRDDVQNGTLINADRTTAAGRFGKITITTEVKGGGTAGSTPESDALLRMSGFSKTTAAGVSVRYNTLDTGMETASLYCWSIGKLFKLVGAAATMKLSADASKRGLLTFEITGRLVADPTETALPTLAFSSVLPPLFHSAAAAIGAWTSADADPLVIKTAAIDTQATIVDRPSAGATDGLIGFTVSDRKTEQTMKIEVPALATFDPFTLSKSAGTLVPATNWQIGTVVGNRLKVLTGKWSLRAPKAGADRSVSIYDLAGSLGTGASGAATRELSLLFD
jgi:hypothetical protein